MTIYWIIFAGLAWLFSSAKRRLRRQQRALDRQVSRFDEFTAENLRQQRRSDRELDARWVKPPE